MALQSLGIMAHRGQLSFIDHGPGVLCSLSPVQVVNLMQNPQCLVPKQSCYSFYRHRRDKNWGNLTQSGVKPWIWSMISRRADHLATGLQLCYISNFLRPLYAFGDIQTKESIFNFKKIRIAEKFANVTAFKVSDLISNFKSLLLLHVSCYSMLY